jgi:peptide/nickel transport system permease protein
MKKLVKKILFTIGLGIISIIITSIISFFISLTIPGDPVLAYMREGLYSQAYYDQIYHELGLDQPIFIQLFKYIADMILGSWGLSQSISHGYPVFVLIMNRSFPTITLLLVPLIVGLVLGYFVGNNSLRFKSRKRINIIKIASLAGVIIPIILLILSFQFFSISIIPILELILLWIGLIIPIMAMTILFVHLKLNKPIDRDSHRRSNNSFLLLLGVGYAIIYVLLIQTEIMYSLDGLGTLFLQAISSVDYYVIRAIIFLFFFFFPIFIIFCLFSFYLFIRIKNNPKNSH